MRISDWSSDVCSSDLQKKYGLLIDYRGILKAQDTALTEYQDLAERTQGGFDLNDIDELYADVSTEYKRLPNLHADLWTIFKPVKKRADIEQRSEEHTSELQSLMRTSYAVSGLKK